MDRSKQFLFLTVSLKLLYLTSSLYLIKDSGGNLKDLPTESCIKCDEILYVDIPNIQHQAGRLYLVNAYSDCKKLGNTLIESTSASNILYYDISMVDGLTCYPQYIHDNGSRVLNQVSAETFCGKSMCRSVCTETKDPHECQTLQPYTHHFGDSLRRSSLGNSSVYTYAYDDSMGLLSTHNTRVRMEFPSVEKENDAQLLSKSPEAKSGTGIVLFSYLLLTFFAYL